MGGRLLLISGSVLGRSHPDAGELSLLESLDLLRAHLEDRLGNGGRRCKQQRGVFSARRVLHVSGLVGAWQGRILIRFMTWSRRV